METVGQCHVTGTGALMHQTRPALLLPRVQSNPTKVTKSKKVTFDTSVQGRTLEEGESQKKLHSQTKATVEESEIAQNRAHVSHDSSLTYERTIRELKLQHNQALANLTTEMESERILLEEKICKLKQNIANALQENSRERQRQLQELCKENTSLRQEITILESQLKTQRAPKMCEKCQSLEMAMEGKNLQLTETEDVVEELQSFCRKFCKQLTQQDQLLAMMSILKRPK